MFMALLQDYCYCIVKGENLITGFGETDAVYNDSMLSSTGINGKVNKLSPNKDSKLSVS